MSKSIFIATPRVMAWSKLLFALMLAMIISAIDVGSVYAIVHITLHWSPSLMAVYSVFGGVSAFCWLLIGLLSSRRSRTLRGGI